MSEDWFSLDEVSGSLARMVGGRLEGDSNLRIKGVNALDAAGPDEVSFLGNPKYAAAARSSKAGCLLLPESSPNFSCQAPSRIYVEDPQYAFSLILAAIEARLPAPRALVDSKASVHYEARLAPEVSIGAFSVVERGAEVGEHTTIAPQCFIGAQAKIGRNCRIYPQVVVRERCVVGDRVVIHSGTVIGADGFGFSTDKKTGRHRKIPQLGNVVVEDEVEIGANAAIDRATIGSTVVGAGTKIDNLVQIGHNVRVGKGCLIVSQAGVAGSTQIGDRAILAGQSGISGHVKIGPGAIIMARSGVMGDIEPGAVVFGTPARPRGEALRLQALYGRLPELFNRFRKSGKDGAAEKA